MTPKRIQRKRTAGWRMPANTVYVGRPTIFGNPWTLKAAYESKLFIPEHVPQIVVDEFEAWLTKLISPNSEHLGIWKRDDMIEKRAAILAALPTLRGKDLACWCPEGQPCHADVLIKLANMTQPTTITDMFTGQTVMLRKTNYPAEPSEAWTDGWTASMNGEPKSPPPWYSLPSEVADWVEGYELAERD